jgi:hypothetical protein
MSPKTRRQHGASFLTSEQGAADLPTRWPRAIRLTGANGRSCIYVPITENGGVVDSKG